MPKAEEHFARLSRRLQVQRRKRRAGATQVQHHPMPWVTGGERVDSWPYRWEMPEQQKRKRGKKRGNSTEIYNLQLALERFSGRNVAVTPPRQRGMMNDDRQILMRLDYYSAFLVLRSSLFTASAQQLGVS